MGLLDQIIGGLTGGSGGASPIQGVLMNMLGGENQQTGRGGGLQGLIAGFEQAGLGHIVQSWIGNGPNQPVSAQQLQTALGDDHVQNMASQAGMAPQNLLSELSRHLPNAVNGMTPNGRLPDEGTVWV